MPRLHAIAVIREADAAGASGALDAGLRARAQELRGRAVGALAAALGGDRLAAEYVLLQLVSRCADAEPLLAHAVQLHDQRSCRTKTFQSLLMSPGTFLAQQSAYANALLITSCLVGMKVPNLALAHTASP